MGLGVHVVPDRPLSVRLDVVCCLVLSLYFFFGCNCIVRGNLISCLVLACIFITLEYLISVSNTLIWPTFRNFPASA